MSLAELAARLAGRGASTLALSVALALSAAPAMAQSQGGGATEAAAASDAADEADDDQADEELLSADDLDALAAPVALYPDSLLTQVLVASTYPLDVVKAGRWVEDNADLEPAERDDAAAEEGWDPSVAALAAGFPTVVARMSDNLDWTQQMGDAMLSQSDDVLDAVQRMRGQAQNVGNLTSNDAQTVTVEGDNIYIEPTSEDRVYVPAYDSQAVYAQQSSTPVVIHDDDDDGWSTGDVLATGAIAFGGALLVSEIFDDDDDWGGYWRPGPPPIRWGGGGFYPRPWAPGRPGRPGRVNIGNSVNFDVDRNGRWEPGRDRRDDAVRRLATRDPNLRPKMTGIPPSARRGPSEAAIRDRLDSNNRDRPNLGGNDRNRPNLGGIDNNRPNLGGGDKNRPNLGGGDKNRPNLGGGDKNRPSLGGGDRNRPSIGGKSGSGSANLKKSSPPKIGGGSPAIKRPTTAASRPAIKPKAPSGGGVFKAGGSAGALSKAQNRGASSASRAKLPVGNSHAARGGGKIGGKRR